MWYTRQDKLDLSSYHVALKQLPLSQELNIFCARVR